MIRTIPLSQHYSDRTAYSRAANQRVYGQAVVSEVPKPTKKTKCQKSSKARQPTGQNNYPYKPAIKSHLSTRASSLKNLLITSS